MLKTVSDIVDLVTIQMESSVSALSSDGLEYASESALTELGWSLPVSNPTQSLWIVKRAVRNACFILLIAAAQKFKYKQVNLQHRFEQYQKLIALMDKEFEDAISSQPSVFGSVDTYKMFGFYVRAGFKYDYTGVDLTYEDLCLYINVGE